ncbi:MAG: hypothetical protein HYY01_15610 [Chloroflexi bacterium]|nr:hypothetical protein [Chloroflexota bacterium]
MSDIIDEASALLQCRECPWYRSCALPLRVTPEDLNRQLRGMQAPGNEAALADLLTGMASVAQNAVLEGCPIFIQRLRESPRLAQRLKEMMRDWP